MNLKLLRILFFASLLTNFSCTTYKHVPYFTDLGNTASIEKITNYKPLTIESGDIISIHVSSMNSQADAVFNANAEYKLDKATTAVSPTDLPTDNTAPGYLVDPEGMVNLPYIGRMKVSGLTTKEITEQIEKKLEDFFTKPIINVRIQNFKVSVLGDVKTPGVFHVQNEKISVTEALSLAGDLNITGIRTDVLVIRENAGVRQYYHIDLTSKYVFNSPCYYLKNNDQIYVRPNRAKMSNSDNLFQKASLAVAVLSLIAFLIRK
jgi:polysaccharide export outer membrane protein